MATTSPRRIVLGISGASGAAYTLRVIELLARAGCEVHVTASVLGKRLLFDELGMKQLDKEQLSNGRGESVVIHNDNDLGGLPASGSWLHDGMIVLPCSSNSLGRIASGITENLLQRAAYVTLKEHRPLILAHRESPLTTIDLENMKRVMKAGGIIAPLSPGFYLLPQSIEDLVDFMAGKLLDLLNIEHDLQIRWEEKAQS